MLAERVRESLKNVKDKILNTPFRGITESLDEIRYNQKWLEDRVHIRPAGDKYDYCFVWCLCCAYINLIATKPWEEIAGALKQVSEKYFDHIGGSVHLVSGLTQELSKFLNVPYYIDRAAILSGNLANQVKIVNDIRKRNNLGINYFLMSHYEPQHYMYISHTGIEINPFPGYQGRFIGFQVYQFFKMDE